MSTSPTLASLTIRSRWPLWAAGRRPSARASTLSGRIVCLRRTPMHDSLPRVRRRSAASVLPVSLLLLVLLPLLLMPLAAIYIFAGSSGPAGFWVALRQPDAQFALRFSVLIAFATAIIHGVSVTCVACVLSHVR